MIIKSITILTAVLLMASCQSSSKIVVNDFFGIKMTPAEAKYFEIATYDEKSGASYRQSANMDPDLSAWAEILDKKIKFKIVNKTDQPVASDYINDQFILVTNDNQEYPMVKGRGIDYPSTGNIMPHTEIDYLLAMPTNFRDSQLMTVQETDGLDVTHNYWQGSSTLNTGKDNIKFIKIKLSSGDIIILKPVPPPHLPGQY